MGSGSAIQIILPLALFTIMLGVGMSLRLREFSALWLQPKTILLALSAQLILLPVLGFIVVTLFQLPAALAVGIMILTFAPGGATSNMITFLSRGDTALSVCLTGITGLITPLTMPLFTLLAIGYWMGGQASFEFPILATMLKLLFVAVLPALLGALIQHRWPGFCQRSQIIVKALACLFLILVVMGIVKSNWDKLPGFLLQVGPAVLVLVVLAMSVGYLVAKKARLSTEQSLTMSVEVGIQNAATALLITGGILHNSEMSASVLIYGVLMNIPAFLLIAYRNMPERGAAGGAV